jgi:hypothetical protein
MSGESLAETRGAMPGSWQSGGKVIPLCCRFDVGLMPLCHRFGVTLIPVWHRFATVSVAF